MLKITRDFSDVEVICNDGKDRCHRAVLCKISDYFTTVLNAVVGTFSGSTTLDCSITAFTFITNSTIYIADKVSVLTPDQVNEIIGLLDILQIKDEFIECVVNALLDTAVDYTGCPDLYKIYMEFVTQFPALLSVGYILEKSLHIDENFMRRFLAQPNLRPWEKLNDKLPVGLVYRLIQENPEILINVLSVGYRAGNLAELINSREDVELFYKYYMRYLGCEYLINNSNGDCGYQYTAFRQILMKKNNKFNGNCRIGYILGALENNL